MGKRRGRKAKVIADVADPQPIIAGLHQQSEDRQTRIMAKGGKGTGRGLAVPMRQTEPKNRFSKRFLI